MRPSDCEGRYSQVTITSAPTLFEPLTFRRIHTREPRKLLSAPVCRSHNAPTTPRALSSFSELIDGAALPYAACTIRVYTRRGTHGSTSCIGGTNGSRVSSGCDRKLSRNARRYVARAYIARAYAHTQLCTRRAVHVENNSVKSRRDPLYPIRLARLHRTNDAISSEEDYRWDL